jgi:hypothetical protein
VISLGIKEGREGGFRVVEGGWEEGIRGEGEKGRKGEKGRHEAQAPSNLVKNYKQTER